MQIQTCVFHRFVHSLLLAALLTAPVSADWWATSDSGAVRFDVRPVAVAQPIDSSSNLQIDVMVSALLPTLTPKAMDQWEIQITPRDEFVQIADYAPRTQLASNLAGPIDVKSTNEQSQSFGMTAAGGYGPGHADAGLDRGEKSIHSTSFQKVAPMRAVIASGTVARGRGVFFRLRAAEQQVLEGEKKFSVTVSVPDSWRADLLDIRIKGERKTRRFGAFQDEVDVVGQAHFVVAVHRSGDVEAQSWARRLAATEDNLRGAAERFHRRRPDRDSVSSLLQRFADKLDFDSESGDTLSAADRWVERLLAGQANPYTDETIKKLPVDLRVVAIDYCDQVRELSDLQSVPSPTMTKNQRYVTAKVPIDAP